MIDISEGITLFNNQDYFEAHDYFEDKWLEAGPKERKFLQGLVQVSVGSFHLISGNKKGALSQYTKAYRKFRKYFSPYEGVDLLALTNQLKVLIDDLRLFFDGNLDEIDLQKLPSLIYLDTSSF